MAIKSRASDQRKSSKPVKMQKVNNHGDNRYVGSKVTIGNLVKTLRAGNHEIRHERRRHLLTLNRRAWLMRGLLLSKVTGSNRPCDSFMCSFRESDGRRGDRVMFPSGHRKTSISAILLPRTVPLTEGTRMKCMAGVTLGPT